MGRQNQGGSHADVFDCPVSWPYNRRVGGTYQKSGPLPKGVTSQVVGTSADGVTVITVWDNEEGEQFFNDRVKPVLDKSGINPKVSKLKIHKHYQRQ
jgi:hypothetical protein